MATSAGAVSNCQGTVGYRDPLGHINDQSANAALKRLGYGERLVAHGLRSLGSILLTFQIVRFLGYVHLFLWACGGKELYKPLVTHLGIQIPLAADSLMMAIQNNIVAAHLENAGEQQEQAYALLMLRHMVVNGDDHSLAHELRGHHERRHHIDTQSPKRRNGYSACEYPW